MIVRKVNIFHLFGFILAHHLPFKQWLSFGSYFAQRAEEKFYLTLYILISVVYLDWVLRVSGLELGLASTESQQWRDVEQNSETGLWLPNSLEIPTPGLAGVRRFYTQNFAPGVNFISRKYFSSQFQVYKLIF